MQYKKKTYEQKVISRLRSQGYRRVQKLLDKDPSLGRYEAKHIVQSEIRKKYNMKYFRLL